MHINKTKSQGILHSFELLYTFVLVGLPVSNIIHFMV